MNRIVGYFDNNGNSCDLINCDYIQLELLGPHAKTEGANALVSKNCIDTILVFSWYLGKDNYPVAYQSVDGKIKLGKGLKMHKLLHLNAPSGMVIDHINRNRLDNRMENIRICTQKENSFNTSKNKNSKNKYKGVKQMKNGLWKASITHNKNKYEINDIPNELDAAKVYDSMAEELFGDYAGKNFF